MLFKEIVDGRTLGRTHGRRTPDIEGSQKLTEHFVLRWAKKQCTVEVLNKSVKKMTLVDFDYIFKKNFCIYMYGTCRTVHGM